MLRHFIFGHVSTANIRRGLKREFRTVLFSRPRPLLKAINRETAKIIKENIELVVDQSSKGHLELSAMLLATYRVLLPRMGVEEAVISLIKSGAMRGMNTLPMRVVLKANLFFCRKKPDRLYKLFGWLMRQYGTSFRWEEPHTHKRGKCSFAFVINKCFYFELFKNLGVPQLTPVLCQLDALWFNQIKGKRDGYIFDFTKYRTQGYGAKTCNFPIHQLD